MSLLRRTRLDKANLLAEARRRQAALLAAHQAERAESAALLEPLYFELEELVAPERIATFASRRLPRVGWLVETDYFPGLNDDATRKERARLLAARSSRRPQLGFDAGNGLVLALSWDSGRIARFQRAAHGMLIPYGEMTRLEELASSPQFAGPGRARAIVPRAEAYALFGESLSISRDDRNRVAGRLRAAIAAARTRVGAEEPIPPFESVANGAPLDGRSVFELRPRLERLAASQGVEDLDPFDERTLADGSLIAPEAEAAAARLAHGMRGLVARLRSGFPAAHRPPDGS